MSNPTSEPLRVETTAGETIMISPKMNDDVSLDTVERLIRSSIFPSHSQLMFRVFTLAKFESMPHSTLIQLLSQGHFIVVRGCETVAKKFDLDGLASIKNVDSIVNIQGVWQQCSISPILTEYFQICPSLLKMGITPPS